MDIFSAAKALNNNQYRSEGDKALFEKMKAAGLVAVFGASDDLMEFRGAIYDEADAPGVAYITPEGMPKNDCDDGYCPYFEKVLEGAAQIKAVWCPEGRDLSWAYETTIPHATFIIMEDDEPYCEGIVFALSDVRPIMTPKKSYSEITEEADRLMQLAVMYLEDGAPKTAADRLREAADRADELAVIRASMISKAA